MLPWQLNDILSGVSFLEFCPRMQPSAQNGQFLVNIAFNSKISWKFHFFGKWQHPRTKFKKADSP